MHTSCIHTCIVLPVLSARRYIHTYIIHAYIMHTYIYCTPNTPGSSMYTSIPLNAPINAPIDAPIDCAPKPPCKTAIASVLCSMLQSNFDSGHPMGFKKYRFAQIWGGGGGGARGSYLARGLLVYVFSLYKVTKTEISRNIRLLIFAMGHKIL